MGDKRALEGRKQLLGGLPLARAQQRADRQPPARAQREAFVAGHHREQLGPRRGCPREPNQAAEPESALLRRAKRLLESVEGEAHARLSHLVDSWLDSEPDQRGDIEDELLDLFLEIEAED